MLTRLPHLGPDVVLRPIRPDDADALVHMHAGLSDRTLHQRFLGAHPRLSQTELRYLTEVDGRDHVALVVADGGDLLAVGRWIREPEDPSTAEAAFLVADGLQGRGVGSILAAGLADLAAAAGVQRLTGTMLATNRASISLYVRLDQSLTVRRDGFVTEVAAEVDRDRDHLASYLASRTEPPATSDMTVAA